MDSTVFARQRSSEKLSAILQEMSEDIDGLTRRVVETIRREIPAYRDFPLEIHLGDNRSTLLNIVSGLARFEPPDRRSIEHAHFMGRQRALVRVRLSTATEGFHVAYGAVWQELLERTEATGDPQVKDELTGYVTPLWTWIHRMSTAFSTAYTETVNSLQASRSDKRALVHEAMRSEVVVTDSAHEAVEALGFDRTGVFTVLVGSPLAAELTQKVSALLADLPDPTELIRPGPESIILTQSEETGGVHDVLRTAGGIDRIGIGRPHVGFTAASHTYSEARRAFACTSDARPVARLSEVWPTALVKENSDLVADLLQTGLDVARSHPHLAEAVAAFAASRFSLTAAARAVHLHPNTAKYRLRRWQELTGWDVYTSLGLTSSLACLELADR